MTGSHRANQQTRITCFIPTFMNWIYFLTYRKQIWKVFKSSDLKVSTCRLAPTNKFTQLHFHQNQVAGRMAIIYPFCQQNCSLEGWTRQQQRFSGQSNVARLFVYFATLDCPGATGMFLWLEQRYQFLCIFLQRSCQGRPLRSGNLKLPEIQRNW